MRMLLTVSLFFLLNACSEVNAPAGKGNLIHTSLKTTQLPDGGLDYAVWEPPGYKVGQKLPLIISLHGGGGSQEELESCAALQFQKRWRKVTSLRLFGPCHLLADLSI